MARVRVSPERLSGSHSVPVTLLWQLILTSLPGWFSTEE